MEHILILIAEIGGAGAVFYGLFVYLFKNAFTTLVAPLQKSIDLLAFNVGEMTGTLKQQQKKIDVLEGRIDGHETRITVIEHDHEKGEV